MSNRRESEQMRTWDGTPFTTRHDPDGVILVSVPNVANGKASKRVKRNGAGYYSLDGQTFANLELVANGMRWAL